MAELTIGQLIKIILGILVVVAVSIGVYIVFQNQIVDFFKGLSAGNVTEMFMVFIK